MILDSLQTVFAFVVTLGILVSIHEYGHFWVARKCGIKVLRFSVGFGTPLVRWHDKQGTEYVVAAIPLGGYVKMLDEREAPVSEQEKHLSFNSKPVLSRIAVVAAGPLANFLLAVAALWLMYILGVSAIVPQVDEVISGSPAAAAEIQAGDEIVAINGHETPGWQQVSIELLAFIGENRSIDVAVRSGEPGQLPQGSESIRRVVLENWLVGQNSLDPIHSLGVIPFAPKIRAILGEISPDGAADKAGLKPGDRVISMDGRPIVDWLDWVELIRANPQRTLPVLIERDGQQHTVMLTPGLKKVENQSFGYIGAGVAPFDWPDDMVRTLQFNPATAVYKAVGATASLAGVTLDSIGKMIVGLVSVKNLSGPVTIAKVAGESLQSGLENFLYFLAMLSVSLGVLNLLPIPVLDGGHLLFYLVEWVRGKPLSDKIQAFGVKVGVTLVVSVMILALYNDLNRLF